MIHQILSALNNFLDRQNDRDRQILSVARHFMIDLNFATKQHADNPEAMAAIIRIADAAIWASERSDLAGMEDSLAAMQEWVRR